MKNLKVHFDTKAGLLLIRNNQRQTVATVNTNQSEKQALDLAYLFAAAPDMREALEVVSSHFKATGMSKEERLVNEAVSAALAKARGV